LFVSLELSEGNAKYHITQDEAKEIYGIVLGGEDLVADLAETEKLRASLRQKRIQEPR